MKASCFIASLFIAGSSFLYVPLAGQEDTLRDDWGSLGRYRADNESLGVPEPGEHRVVFYGNSITDTCA